MTSPFAANLVPPPQEPTLHLIKAQSLKAPTLKAQTLKAQTLKAQRSSLPQTATALTLGLLSLTPHPRAQAPAPQLAVVLTQMDASSKIFSSASASFAWEFYQRIVHDTTRQQGTMYIERAKTGTGTVSLGTTVYDLDPNGKPLPAPSKIIDFADGVARLYSPAEKQVDRFKAGANQANFESFLSLGFGGSGTALAKDWAITDNGPETLPEAGHPVKVEKLTLVSKDPGVRDTVKQVTIWVDPTRDVSLKQVFLLPNGDSRTAVYTDLRLNNPKLNKKPYDIPKSATVVQH